MRILVTGGAGFLGSHLVALMRDLGHDPIVPRQRNYNLTDQVATRRLFKESRPQVVFHLAAEVGGIGANRDHPGRYWYANLAMGLNVLESCRESGVQRVLMVGTICAYPNHAPLPFSEESLWDGFPEETNAPYGIAKRSLIVGAQAYQRQYGLDVITVLPVNLYGPGDCFQRERSHVIPAMIQVMADARNENVPEVVLWGDGTPTREFLYVEDCARAIWLAFERYNGAVPTNLGSGEEIEIRALAELVARTTEYEGRLAWDTSQPNGQPRRRVDSGRARREFGFSPSVPLADGIKRTVEWYREFGRQNYAQV